MTICMKERNPLCLEIAWTELSLKEEIIKLCVSEDFYTDADTVC